jgi:hypothetical protein
MKNRYLLIIFALLVAVFGLSACGNGTAAGTNAPVTPAKTGATTPPAPPNPTPAIFKISNLRVVSRTEYLTNCYAFYVDVENVGGNAGMFKGYYQIDGSEKIDEPKPVLIGPGKKRPVELTGVQPAILQIGQSYDSGDIQEKNHLVQVGDLSITITLADRYKLKLLTDEMNLEDMTISGQVQNISAETLDHVMVAVDFYSLMDDKYIRTEQALIENTSLSPNQISAFKVAYKGRDVPPGQYRIMFADTNGVIIRTTIVPATK